jgi:hypothetical protein
MSEMASQNWIQMQEQEEEAVYLQQQQQQQPEGQQLEQEQDGGSVRQQQQLQDQQRRREEREARRREERERRLAKRVVACHTGRGQIAASGFQNPSFVEGRLFVYDDPDTIGFLWTDDVGFLIDFERLRLP